MNYFVTGATGFIGRYLVSQLMRREGTIYVLVRASSQAKLDALRQACGDDGSRIVPVAGDLAQPLLGVDAEARAQLRGRVRHLFHLGALYDLAADDAALELANVAGTRHVLDFAADVQAGCLHLVSSIASAGRYPGRFTEDMFAEAVGLDHPYFRTKHESERLVREDGRVPWRVYRPAMVLGHSRTGQIDKVDGPYYLFKAMQKLRQNIPQWMPLVGFEGGHLNMVPVDFVAAALDHLAHVPGEDGRCFHLTDPVDRRVGAVTNVFLKAAHAPQMTVRLDPALTRMLPRFVGGAAAALRPVQRIVDEVIRDTGIPRSVLGYLDNPTSYDCSRTQALLKGTGIRVPALEDYAWRLWDYWERHLDPDLDRDRSLRGAAEGRVVMVTGGSSGIGRALALRLADAGAHVLVVARDPERLAAVQAEIGQRGGTVTTYSCDIADPAACDALVAQVLAAHGHVDVLVNNAGRSIRRAIENSLDRFHDYERLMRLNYFAAVRLTMGLLPSMLARRAGHVINVSSIGVLSNAPRFSAYVASKAALEAFSRCAAAEFSDRGIAFTVVNMPLVRTPMIAPTRIYEQMPLIEPGEAAEMLCDAVIHRPKRVATKLGLFAMVLNLFAPKVSELVMSNAFRMFPESEAAGGQATRPAPPSDEMIAFATLLRGIHW